ncbi:MAG: hypothetical protein N4A68_04015 [Maledivibacter sp.]|jgi:hypothetical protein|nr:hypothetical protein [Maledivibacter sp.]
MKTKKLGVYFVVSMLMVSFVFVAAGIQVYAAEVGDQLPQPEDGWKRYDNGNDKIIYEGDYWRNVHGFAGFYKDTHHSTFPNASLGHAIKFKFTGTKLRILSGSNATYSDHIIINIDGVEHYFSEKGPENFGALNFEATGLQNSIHDVQIIGTDSEYMALDAIDIDETGELLDINTPTLVTNLTATAGNKEVKLSWDKVEGAEKYVVKRSTTKGGEYKEIGETKETSYTDSGLENGTTYYYVVCAVKSGVTSPDSKEASATPQKSSSGGGSGDRAILRITMVNGKINEYDLSMDDVNDFIDWYEDSIDDKDDPYYTIEKDYNIGPFESKKDYIVADKILQFEVMEYED